MLPKKHASKFEMLKANVEQSRKYFDNNTRRYQEDMRFVFQTTLNNIDIQKLNIMQKPIIEFPILEAYISSLIGQFVKQEPTITVSASDSMSLDRKTPEFFQMLDFLEGHIREVLYIANRDGFAEGMYRQCLGGGFAVGQVYTDFSNEMSFEKRIVLKPAFDSTLCGWDPMARESHKGDGGYCFECIPRLREDFEEEFGPETTATLSFTKAFAGFQWSFKDQELGDIVMEVIYYEKQTKDTRIFKLSNGHVVTERQYKEFLEVWEASGKLEQAPVVVEKRNTQLETIHRYRMAGTQILDHEETYYKYLPLVFFDGNSVMIKTAGDGEATQYTRSYAHHAKGAQTLYNFAGQTMANELENMVQQKYRACIEGIPDSQQDAYANPQIANVLTYHAYDPERPEVQLPPPEVIPRMPAPPTLSEAFQMMPNTIQAILGSYDAQLGIVGDKISGAAIEKGAIQSGFNSSPYLINHIKSMTRVAEIIVDLIPKFYVTPRSIPIRGSDGKRDYVLINTEQNAQGQQTPQGGQQQMQGQQMQGQQQDQQMEGAAQQGGNPNMQGGQQMHKINFDYDSHDLEVKLEAGVSNVLQKQASLQMIVQMAGSSEIFSEFINTYGLETMLDNMDIRGIDKLKEMAAHFMQQKQQAAEQAAQQPSPEQQLLQTQEKIAMAQIQARQAEHQGNLSIQTAKVAVEKEKADNQHLEALAKLELTADESVLAKEQADSEAAHRAIEAAINLSAHVNEQEQMATEGQQNQP